MGPRVPELWWRTGPQHDTKGGIKADGILVFVRGVNKADPGAGRRGELRGARERSPTWLRVQPAGVEELGGEVDVHVAEEEQHVAPRPGAGAHVQPLSPRELPIQLDEGEVPEVGGSER